MKSHISATIERSLLEKVDRYRRSVRRSRSQIIELAIERLFEENQVFDQGIVTSEGAFQGQFFRDNTYER